MQEVHKVPLPAQGEVAELEGLSHSDSSKAVLTDMQI